MTFFVSSLFFYLFCLTTVKAKEFWLHKYKRSCFITKENKVVKSD